MKKLEGWLEPFNFNDDQKRDLILALSPKAKSNNEIHLLFVTRCEIKIAEWGKISQGGIRRISDQLNRMQKISKQADDLLKTINGLDQVQCSLLKTQARGILYSTTGYDALLKTKLIKMEHVPEYETNDVYLGESLIESVELLSESAKKIALESVDQGGRYSPDIEFLISNLAQAYARTYKKNPGYAEGSKFRRFVTELGSICSFKAGRKILEPIIKNLPPPP